MTATTHVRLSVLEEQAFLSKSDRAEAMLRAGHLVVTYRGWSDVQPAWVYALDGAIVDVETACRAMEAE